MEEPGRNDKKNMKRKKMLGYRKNFGSTSMFYFSGLKEILSKTQGKALEMSDINICYHEQICDLV